MTRKHLVVGALLVAVALVMMPIGASAHGPDAGAAAFTGTAATPGGLWFPEVAGPSATGTGWSFTSDPGATGCAGIGCPVSGSGDLNDGLSGLGAYCGASGGTGTGSVGGHSVTITWLQSAGSILPTIVGDAPAHAGAALVNARPVQPADFPTNVACLTVAATNFTIAGVGAAAGTGL